MACRGTLDFSRLDRAHRRLDADATALKVAQDAAGLTADRDPVL